MFYKNRILHKRIGRLLMERGIITEKQLDEALDLQRKQEDHNKKLLGEILIELGYADEETVINSVTTQYGIPYLPLDNYEVDQQLIEEIPQELVVKYGFLPIDKMGDLLTIAIPDIPPDAETIKEIEQALSYKIETFVSGPSALRRAIEKYYGYTGV